LLEDVDDFINDGVLLYK